MDYKYQLDYKQQEVTNNLKRLGKIELPEIEFRVVCSKGTYIRSLAHDFGKALNSGAHLSRLCRRRIGNFHLNQAIDIEALKAHVESQDIPESDV